jgi:hypothetical protein
MRPAFVISVLLVIMMSNQSCKRNPYKVNISESEVKIELMRMEKDMFGISPADIPAAVPELNRKYGYALQLFSWVINTGDVTSPSWHQYLNAFVTSKMNYDAYNSVIGKYDDLSSLEDRLSKAFSHYAYYFPERHIPSLFTCVSGFNNSIIVGDSVLGISLDRYLGPDSEYYKMLGIYSYLTLKMDEPNIVPDCMYAWSVTEWDYEELDYGSKNLFSRIIHEGKLFYFVRCMLPDVDANEIFGFSQDQISFCIANEGSMWTYLVEHNLLFSVDQLVIRKLTGEAPFTSYFTNESPGRAALWVGFRIVEEYMKRNPSVTLSELMLMTDYQKILTGAKYNP